MSLERKSKKPPAYEVALRWVSRGSLINSNAKSRLLIHHLVAFAYVPNGV